jgi:hypothetical protein
MAEQTDQVASQELNLSIPKYIIKALLNRKCELLKYEDGVITYKCQQCEKEHTNKWSEVKSTGTYCVACEQVNTNGKNSLASNPNWSHDSQDWFQEEIRGLKAIMKSYPRGHPKSRHAYARWTFLKNRGK